jgi:ribA/ribD-fused uncharacterized protein
MTRKRKIVEPSNDASTLPSSKQNKILNGPDEFVFFWKQDKPFGEFCQWYEGTFEVDGMEFNCAEQFMMYKKAILFGDSAVAKQILATKSPKKQKQLGRLVKNFDATVWGACKEDIVIEGNLAKFSQSESLKNVSK